MLKQIAQLVATVLQRLLQSMSCPCTLKTIEAACPERCPILSNCLVLLFFVVTTVTASEITKIVQWRRLRNVALAPSCVPYVRPGVCVWGRGRGEYTVISGTSYSQYLRSCIQCLTRLRLFLWSLPAIALPLDIQCSRC